MLLAPLPVLTTVRPLKKKKRFTDHDSENITTWTKEADTLIDEEDKDIQAGDLPDDFDDE